MTHSNILHIVYIEDKKLKIIQVPEYSLKYIENCGLTTDNYFEYNPEDKATYQNRELSENELIFKRSNLVMYGLSSAFRFGEGLSKVSNKDLRESVNTYIDNSYIKDIRDYNYMEVLNSVLGSPITESEFVVDDIMVKYAGILIEKDDNQLVFQVKPYIGGVDIRYSTLTVYRAGDGILHHNTDRGSKTIAIDKGVDIYLVS